MKKLYSLLSSLPGLFFWLWNLSFGAVTYLGIAPLIAVPLVEATFQDLIPWDFSLTLLFLILVPAGCSFIALQRCRHRPQAFLQLFYGVEAPLFLLLMLRLFFMRQLTTASQQIIWSFLVCIAAFGFYMFFGLIDRDLSLGKLTIPRRYLALLQLGAHSIMGLLGLYCAAVMLFYAIPLSWLLIVEFFRFQWLSDLWFILSRDFIAAIWWVPIFLCLVFFSATLFVVMPSVLGFLYIQSGLEGWQSFARRYRPQTAKWGTIATLGFWLTLFALNQWQPHHQAFALLNQPVAQESDRQTLLAKSEQIRRGLLHSYLSPYLYLSTTQDNNHIALLYKNIFGLPASLGRSLQNSYNLLLSPFLYQGSYADVQESEKLYGSFFDTSIQKAEAPTISESVRTTWNRDEAKAGLLNINQRKVLLRRQTINITEHGDWADVEIYEMYENQTPDLQEVFYSFSLPESAVITGLWLGDTDDRTKRHSFQVSPRGAAQEVYNEQVRERIDPALLEQIGTRQYRLRAFPIPAQILRTGSDAPTHMHLWLTYKVMQQPQGWAMPDLGEKRNIFWDRRTDRQINGQTSKPSDRWLPPHIPAQSPFAPKSHAATFVSGQTIAAQPIAEQSYILPQQKRFAILVDTSRSMPRPELTKAWQWLKTTIAPQNELHIYLSAAQGIEPRRLADIQQFDPNKIVFYGSLQFIDILQQFKQLQGDTLYDAIVLLTDDGSYDLATNIPKELQPTFTISPLAAPIWLVHLDGTPSGYDDATLKLIQDSQGGIATDPASLMYRLATTAKLGPNTISLTDGYAWQFAPNPNINPEAGFAPLAARQLALSLSRQAQDLPSLDRLHQLAKDQQIVTPYSSMIVLVNDQQRRALKEAEFRSDRFDREVETGKEQLSQPNNPFSIPTPSPTPLAIVLALFPLSWLLRRRNDIL
jgi:putative PEP-CTERM system integral membrane protein